MIQVGYYTVILNPYVPDLALSLDLKTFFKKNLRPLFMDVVQLLQGYGATTRR